MDTDKRVLFIVRGKILMTKKKEDIYDLDVEFVPEDEVDNHMQDLSYEEAIIMIEDQLMAQGVPEDMAGIQARVLYEQYYSYNPTIH